MFTKTGHWPQPQDDLNPFECWIAEVMLQQTQLAVVLPYWRRWMAAFPTLEALADASLEQVRLQWQGLGYYSRARRLHEAAQTLAVGPWPGTWRAGGAARHRTHHRRRHPLQCLRRYRFWMATFGGFCPP